MPVSADIYKEDIDYVSLASEYPDFANALGAKGKMDFSDSQSDRQLSSALLHRDFGLAVAVPEDRLYPRVPNRFNYILFIQDLLDSTQENYSSVYDPDKKVVGLDIGTGASAVYPLLACRQRPSWHFLATEINAKSKAFAEQNIKDNDLASRIRLLDTNTDGNPIIPSTQLEPYDRIDILLTNPPFFSSDTEIERITQEKATPIKSSCTGSSNEMICPGGEVSFVSQLIDESCDSKNKHKIKWYSSLLGKLVSVRPLVNRLQKVGCTNYVVTEISQGQQNKRWCIAWSWFGLRPSQKVVAGGSGVIETEYLPYPTEMTIFCEGEAVEIMQKVNEKMATLPAMVWQQSSDKPSGIAKSKQEDILGLLVLSKHIPRNGCCCLNEITDSQSLPTQNGEKTSQERDRERSPRKNDERESKLVVKISCESSKAATATDATRSTSTHLTLRWLQGHDHTLFENFHDWLKHNIVQPRRTRE